MQYSDNYPINKSAQSVCGCNSQDGKHTIPMSQSSAKKIEGGSTDVTGDDESLQPDDILILQLLYFDLEDSDNTSLWYY